MLRQFNDVVATLELALEDLHAAHALLAILDELADSAPTAARCSDAVNSALATHTGVTTDFACGGRTADEQARRAAIVEGDDSSQLSCWLNERRQRAAAMSTKLAEWRRVVTSHQSASRVLRWSVSQVGPVQ